MRYLREKCGLALMWAGGPGLLWRITKAQLTQICGPGFKRPTTVIEVERWIVDTRYAGFGLTAYMVDHSLHYVRRNTQFLVHQCHRRAAQVMKGPVRQRIAASIRLSRLL